MIKTDKRKVPDAFLSTFRATARFILPVLYLIQFGVLFTLSKCIKSRPFFLIIMISCAIFQYIEIVPRTAKGGADSIISGYSTVFNDCFDNTFSADAKHLSFISDNYENIAAAGVFASHHNMTMNTSKACRGPKNSVQSDINAWNNGQLSADTVYLIPNESIPYLMPIHLSESYLIYYCNEKICIFHKDLLQKQPDAPAAELDSNLLYDLLEYYYDPNLASTPISTFEDC